MTSEMEHIVLRAKALSIGYATKKNRNLIAESIDLALPKGNLIGLVGANGIGKSTLLRTLAGMQAPLEGSISLLNRDLLDYAPMELASKLSVVLTETPASQNLTVSELVSLGRQPYTNWMGKLNSEDLLAISHALDITDTKKLAERKCFELSDGQRQRVYIARALAQDTPIIILDEPTTHLDLYHRAYVLKLLKRLASEEKKTILFSTHEVDLAIQLSDQMIVMTPQATYIDDPCKLIEAGCFESLFPKEIIQFDKNNGRFTIKP